MAKKNKISELLFIEEVANFECSVFVGPVICSVEDVARGLSLSTLSHRILPFELRPEGRCRVCVPGELFCSQKGKSLFDYRKAPPVRKRFYTFMQKKE